MKKSTIILMWGAITGVANSLFYQFRNIADNPTTSLRYISYLIMFAGLLVGTLQYRKANGGYLSFGEGYKAGILMTLIIAVISTISLAIFLQTHPGFMDKILAQTQAMYVNKGMSSDQIETAMSYARKFTSPAVMTLFGFIGGILTGAIVSLLSAGISIRKKPLIDEDNNAPIQ
jgi:Protein of unknown function (DUF4199)